MCLFRRQAERLVAGTSASPEEVGTSLLALCEHPDPFLGPDRLRCN